MILALLDLFDYRRSNYSVYKQSCELAWVGSRRLDVIVVSHSYCTLNHS